MKLRSAILPLPKSDFRTTTNTNMASTKGVMLISDKTSSPSLAVEKALFFPPYAG